MKRILLTVSVTLNILLLSFGVYIITKKGGIDYLERLVAPPGIGLKQYNSARVQLIEYLPKDTGEIIFLGDSHTEAGEWAEMFRNLKIKNRGIDGDDLKGVNSRIDGILENRPKKIFLLISANDLDKRVPVRKILDEYEKLVKTITAKSPDTKLYIQSNLPTNHKITMPNKEIQEINEGLVVLSKKYHAVYIDLFDLLINDRGELNKEYTYDGEHLDAEGYLIWKKAIEKYVNN